jgi:hypothetical protein
VETLRVTIDVNDRTETADKDNCEPGTKYNYSQCVENKVQEDLLLKLNCIPPWLSPNNHCKATSRDELMMKYFDRSYAKPLLTQTRNKAERLCKKPCIHQVILQSQVHMQCLLDNFKYKIMHLIYVFGELHFKSKEQRCDNSPTQKLTDTISFAYFANGNLWKKNI